MIRVLTLLLLPLLLGACNETTVTQIDACHPHDGEWHCDHEHDGPIFVPVPTVPEPTPVPDLPDIEPPDFTPPIPNPEPLPPSDPPADEPPPDDTPDPPLNAGPPGDCRPGWGRGDANHCHTGPPGHD